MASAAKNFTTPEKSPANLPRDIGLSELVSPELANVAQSFVDLQEARYLADYDVLDAAGEVNLRLARGCLAKADAAFRDWNIEKNSEGARVFLAALLVGKNWGKRSLSGAKETRSNER